MAVIFAAPFSKSISEISVTLCIVLWLLKKIINRRFYVEKNDLAVPMLIFVLTILPSFFNSAYMALSLKAFITKILKYVFFYFVITESIDTREKIKDIFIIGLLAMIIITADGFVQYYYSGTDALHFPGYPSFKYRPTSDLDAGFFRGFPTACFPYPNDLSAWILLMLFPLACVTLFGLARGNISYLGAFLSVSMLYLFVLAKTRGAWIGLGISVLYIAVTRNRVWLILLLIILIAIPYVLKMEMSQYVFNIGSMGDRMSMWGTSWEIFSKHPFIGNGLNTFFRNFMELRNDGFKGKKGSYAHNCYLQMACDTGILGLAAFLWLVFSIMKKGISYARNSKAGFYHAAAIGLIIGIAGFLLHSLVDTNLYSLNLATLFWFSAGFLVAIIRTAESAS